MRKDDTLADRGCGAACTSRRAFLTGAAATAGAAAIAVLGGCATYGNGADEPDPSTSGGGGGGVGTPAPLAKVADVPVGGGLVLEGRRIVVTQPQAGTIKAFTAVCTHQGCVVADVSNGTINCPCHGSAYHIADGSVANGPATRALRSIAVKVEGTEVKLA
ncbi:MAG: Rieske (2Fe-2S) protein [Micromonosporaceae bacterium]